MKPGSRALLSMFIIAAALFSLACQTITRAFSPDPPANPPGGDVSLDMAWLITAEELNSLSTDMGIVGWTVLQDTPGENRICRSFQGASWSAIPNEGLNCVFKIAEGSSFQSVIDSMFNNGQLMEGSTLVNSNVGVGGESAVYAGDYPTGHAVFDLVAVRGNLMYWSSVTLGRQPGAIPQDVYQSASQVIEAFLVRVVNINLDRSK